MIEEDLMFDCPYCGVENATRYEPEGGSHQNFVVDCEVCCQPIVVDIQADAQGEVFLSVSPENE